MRIPTRLLFPTILVGILAACETTSGPERRDLRGSWVSGNLPGVIVRMTLAETSRSVDGAGSWSTPDESAAFRVTGAHAQAEVSLLFDFDSREDVNFQGFFSHEDSIRGQLFGSPYEGVAVTFGREVLGP